MRELRISVSEIQRLTDSERFTYYVLGHIFNELLCLQKLIAFALPKHDDTRPARREPEMGQALLLFRLACGKIWEAQKTINSKEVATTLRRRVLPVLSAGQERLKEINVAISDASWLSKLRNGMGFHSPTFTEWLPLIQPDSTWQPDSIYVGEMTGNTFYAGSDSIAQAWMFGLHGRAELGDAAEGDAVELLIDQMIDLLRLMNRFLEDALGVLVTEILMTSPKPPPSVGKTLAPTFSQVPLPFWTSMPPKA